MPLSHQAGGVGGRTGAGGGPPPLSRGGVTKPKQRGLGRTALEDVTNEGQRRPAPSALPHYKTRRPRDGAPDRAKLADIAGANAARRGGAKVRVPVPSVNFVPKAAAAPGRRLGARPEARAEQELELEQAKLEANELRKKVAVNEDMAKTVEELKNHFLESKGADSSKVDGLCARIEEKDHRIARLEIELAEKRVELTTLNMTIARTEHATESTRTELNSKLEIATAKAAGLEQQLKVVQASNAALEGDKMFVDRTATEKSLALDAAKETIANHDSSVERMRTDAQRATESLTRCEEAKRNLERQLDEASTRAREEKETVCNLQLAAVEGEASLRRMTMQKDELENELGKMKSLLETERKDVISLRELIRDTRDAATETARKFEEEVAALKKGQGTLQEFMDSRVKDLQRQKEESERECVDTRSQLDGARTEVSALKTSISAQESGLTAAKSQLVAVEVKLAAQTEQSVEKAAEIEVLKETIKKQIAEIGKLEEQALLDEDERRRLHNALQELKGNIRVFCRVRPMLPFDSCEPSTSIFSFHDKRRGITAQMPAGEQSKLPHKKPFSFDRVFGPESTQDDVFGEISQLVQSALDGYRVCIFAYGQTGSGKTHTIMGDNKHAGMIPRSIEKVFTRAERMNQDQWTFSFKASFLEIYNEKLRDLLGNQRATRAQTAGAGKGKKEEYDIVFNRDLNECTIDGLTVREITSPESARTLIDGAMKLRATAATQSNAESSRSHSVFRMYISGRNAASGQTLRGVLNLVDLAGSERVKISKAEGERLKETKAINKSLTQLSIVIQSLANKDAHIPYRSSKLTRLLQDSLGGDSKCLMFVNVAPTPASYNESICSLRFAEQVNACEIGVAKKSTKINLQSD